MITYFYILVNCFLTATHTFQEHRDSLPMFMGMPLYGLKKEREEKRKEERKKEFEREEERATMEEYVEGVEGRGGAWGNPLGGDNASNKSWRR